MDSIQNLNCKCPETNCERHGKCEECKENHKDKNKPEYCKREKKSLLKILIHR